MPLVDKRYAQALLDVSMHDIRTARSEFGQLNDLYNSDVEFREFLLDPRIKVNNKQMVVRNVFSGKISDSMLNFLLLLIEKKRINELPGIHNQFEILADQLANALDMKVITIAPLEESQINSLKEKFGKKYSSNEVKITEIIDPSIIGGIKVIVGDKVYDGSVKGRIQSLNELVNI